MWPRSREISLDRKFMLGSGWFSGVARGGAKTREPPPLAAKSLVRRAKTETHRAKIGKILFILRSTSDVDQIYIDASSFIASSFAARQFCLKQVWNKNFHRKLVLSPNCFARNSSADGAVLLWGKVCLRYEDIGDTVRGKTDRNSRWDCSQRNYRAEKCHAVKLLKVELLVTKGLMAKMLTARFPWKPSIYNEGGPSQR